MTTAGLTLGVATSGPRPQLLPDTRVEPVEGANGEMASVGPARASVVDRSDMRLALALAAPGDEVSPPARPHVRLPVAGIRG